METLEKSPVAFTDSAVAEIKRLINEPGFDTTQKLRVGVKGGGCSGMTYILDFEIPKPTDRLYNIEGVEVIMDKSHEMYLTSMTVNWEGGLNARGFTFQNPNASSTCGCGTSFAV